MIAIVIRADDSTTTTASVARDMSILAHYPDRGQIRDWAWGLPVWLLATVTLAITTSPPVVIGPVTGTAPVDRAVDRGSHPDDGRKPIRISTYQKMISTGILVRQLIILIIFLLPRLVITITTDGADQTRRRRAPKTSHHHTWQPTVHGNTSLHIQGRA